MFCLLANIGSPLPEVSFFNILRKLFLCSLGYFHSLLILHKALSNIKLLVTKFYMSSFIDPLFEKLKMNGIIKKTKSNRNGINQ